MATITNRQLTIAVFLSEIANALEEKGIARTEENIEAAATHIETLATAWALGALQETSHDEWLDWIETFKTNRTERRIQQ